MQLYLLLLYAIGLMNSTMRIYCILFVFHCMLKVLFNPYINEYCMRRIKRPYGKLSNSRSGILKK